GITGAGVALDAASRGLSTALVEAGDFASGTSSKSSKMVHGGIRYLQQREFRLVYENLAERQRLLENAPHLVSPVPFLIPLFGKAGVVNRSVARAYRSALWLYDLTGGWRIGRRHQRVTREQALEHLPTLRADQLVAGFLYWDARTDDARLTLCVLRTAALDYGAVAVNHTRVEALVHGADGHVTGARVAPEGADPFDVRARVVVNAAGVWADQVRTLDEGTDPGSLRPAKGVHVTVPADAFPCDIAAVIPVRGDGRSIFVVSWGEQVYLGTTDTAYQGPLDDPSCGPEDVAYLLDAANAVTTRPLEAAQITGIWSGLRPLLAPTAGHRAPSERTADLSRRHTVRAAPSGVVTVTGGKLTTYRKMAEDTVDVVVRELGRRDRCRTRSLALRGAAPVDAAAGGQPPTGSDESATVADHLAGRYGAETPAVLARAEGAPELLQPLVPGLRYLGVEAVYAVEEEMATSLEDVLDRRTRASLRDARATATAAPRVAELVGPLLGWDAERARREADAYAARVRAALDRAGLGHATADGGGGASPGAALGSAVSRPADGR
ncbi:MAG: glycerol-3-phosphate dehydrogenase/oxidase, partial [Acidimicrobiales bacterium]|nr:glycerol-3-phosphate dehydrogenase/oxidase [Acidimicrobiales bacterium]